jgi:hypothetical protein
MRKNVFNTILMPISNDNKTSCMNIWANNHKEESNVKIDYIKEYCMENGCDELSVFYIIYKEIHSKYLCDITYYDMNYSSIENMYVYLSRDEIESKIGEDLKYYFDESHKDKIENMFKILDVKFYYNKYLAKVNGFNDYLQTHFESIYNKEGNYDSEILLIEIEELIEKCISENREYEYKVILKPKSIENMEDFEKKLYIPYSKNSNNSYIPTNIGISNLKQEPIDKKEEEVKIEINDKINDINEIEEDKEIKDNFEIREIEENEADGKTYKSLYSISELKTIFERLIYRNYLYKERKLEDFIYVFGETNKPNDFNKLVWLETSRNGQINKKLLITFCMRIFNLELHEIGKDFFNWAYKRLYTNKILDYNNKPDANELDEKHPLNKVFPTN